MMSLPPIASYIIGHKCEEGKPHCFVSVSHFQDWIERNSGVSLVTESATEDTTNEHTESGSTASNMQTDSEEPEDHESSTEHDATETTSCLSKRGGEESGKSKRLDSVMAFLNQFTEKVLKLAGKPSLLC